ncbi:hypothetical protein [Nonomuraea sp. NPDC050202]|uniref:hypothetical protein n=1 Tax=Nonomuraea sp. NPDC050202 TaxID=3155035 RepID=UPI0033D86523
MPPTAARAASCGLAFLLTAGCAATASEARPPGDTPTRAAAQRDTGAVDHAQICAGQATRVRAEDQRCDDREKDYAWYYVPMTSAVPAVGAKVASGIPYAPPRRTYRASRRGGEGKGVLILDEQDRVKICVQVRTRVRVPDERCDDHLDGYEWYYLLMERHVAAIGKKAERGTFFPPASVETFRARPGGGKGSKVMVRPATDPPETDEPDEPDPRPARSATPEPSVTTARPTARPTSKSRRCRTIRSGTSTSRTCS